VFLNDKWQVKKWSGALQLQQQEIVANGGARLQSYLQNESSLQQQKRRRPSRCSRSEIPRCRTATRSRRGARSSPPTDCPRNDEAFNEDARVQLNNLKLQQALVGLNVRQAAVNGGGGAMRGQAANAERTAEQQGRELHAAGREADH
jgi:hypothetical protein